MKLDDNPLRVVQITDTHLFADPRRCLMGCDSQASLERVLAHLRSQADPPDVLLATGDLVHDDQPDGYRRLAALLEAFQVPVFCLPGNHDDPGLMATHLNQGWVRTLSHSLQGGWALLFLNTRVPGSASGHLADLELQRLSADLERFRHLPTLVCLHHNPVPVGSTGLDRMRVDNGAQLLELLAGHAQVKALLWGHVHQVYDAWYQHIRLLASPSTSAQFLAFSNGFDLDSQAPGFRWLQLWRDGRLDTGVVRIPETTA
jgi:Icc protein